MSKLAPIALALLLSVPAVADEKNDTVDGPTAEVGARVGIPIAGLRRSADVAALREVLSKKLGARASCDVVAKVWITFVVADGCKVSLTDIRRIVEKVARKRRLPLTLGDPQLGGRVELATDFKRPKHAALARLIGGLKAVEGVTLERPESKSVKRIPMRVEGEDVRLSSLARVVRTSLALGAPPFRDVVWYGPPGSWRARNAGKGGKKDGGKGLPGRPDRCPDYGPAPKPGKTRMETVSQKPGHAWQRVGK